MLRANTNKSTMLKKFRMKELPVTTYCYDVAKVVKSTHGMQGNAISFTVFDQSPVSEVRTHE